MRRGVWIGLAALIMVVVAVVAVRIYQDRPQAQRWVLAAPPGVEKELPRSARRFEISIDSGQCNPPESPVDRIEVDENAETVTVTAFIDPPGSPLAPQTSAEDCLTFVGGTVELGEPIGTRTLVVGDFEHVDPTRGSP